ncbi:MAG: diaminopimelate decarboxylase, partial [Rhodospirillales bacterium]|nr:diaminopimelate decarboxylase [Rhodospirillales bacterium]
DAAMNDLIRPTLYEAHHEIWPVSEKLRQSGTIGDDAFHRIEEELDLIELTSDPRLYVPDPGS